MTIAHIEAGTLTANEEERTVSGLLLKFGELGKTNLGKFSVAKGAFKLPADVTSFLPLLHTHNRPAKNIGTALFATETDEGIYASWRIDEGPEGDALLAGWASGDPETPRKLSIEVDGVKIRNGVAIDGVAHGAAVVTNGAFPSSTLLAADTPDEEPVAAEPAAATEPTETTGTVTDEFTDENGQTFKRTVTTTTRTEPDGEGGTKTTITEKTVLEEPDPAGTNEEEEPTVAVPNTLTAGKAATATPRPKHDINQIAAAISDLRSNPNAHDARTLLAALSDITISGSGALPAAGVLQNNWLGLLDQGDTYERQYVTLGQLGTDITAAGKKGFTVSRGTVGSPVGSYARQGAWAGNKAAIFSGQGYTATKQSVLDKFAIGEDIAREFYDLPGGEEAILAFLSLLDEDHKVWSDLTALGYWQQAAGAPIAAATNIPTEYPGTLGKIIQGIIAVKKRKADNRRDTPTFAILNDAAYEELLYTPFEMIPEFIKFSVDTDGTGTANGDVLIVNGDTGIQDTPSVLVGARKAIQFDELAGGPLHVDALDIARGGIDKAVHGYLQTFIVRPEAVKTVGVADTRGNTTPYSEGRIIKNGATVYRVVVGGTSAGSAPTAPAVGATVADGSATLLRLA